MEKLKNQLPVLLGFLSFVIIIGLIYYLFVWQSTVYYVQVDNSDVKTLSSTDQMKYEYHLLSYNEQGHPKKIKFKTSRKLKESAYLQVEYMYTRGVTHWSEIQFHDLPMEVQKKWKVIY